VTTAGDLREAEHLLDEAVRSAGTPGGRGWLAVQLATARLLQEHGRRPEADEVVDRTLEGLAESPQQPTDWVKTAVRGLAGVSERDEAAAARSRRYLEVLLHWLARVEPRAGRLQMLDDLWQVATALPGDADQLRALRRLTVDAAPGDDLPPVTGPRDRVVELFRTAEVLRVLGEVAEARSAADEGLGLAGDDPLAWWTWLSTVGRIGGHGPDEQPPPRDALRSYEPVSPLLVAAFHVLSAERYQSVEPPERVAARLAAAEHLLEAVPRALQWRVRLVAVRAALAERAEDPLRAHREGAEAARLSSQLGDVRHRQKLVHHFDLERRPTAAETKVVQVDVSALDGSSGRLEVSLRDSTGAHVTRTVSTDGLDDPGARAPTLHRLRAVTRSLADNWSDWGRRVGRELLPDLDAVLGPADQQTDIRIVPSTRELAALPWEFVSPSQPGAAPLPQDPRTQVFYRSVASDLREEAKTRALQVALRRLGHFDGVPDGLVGEVTSESVRRIQADAGLLVDGVADRLTWGVIRSALDRTLAARPPHVLVVRASPAREIQRQRDWAPPGLDVPRSYARRGAVVATLDDPCAADLARYAADRDREPPDIVHVCASVRLIGGATVLDAGGRAQTSTGGISVTQLAELLGRSAREPFGPVLVLDTPPPPTPEEAARTLALRNSFAHQVLRLNACVGVLACGLAAPDERRRALETVVEGLTGDGTVADVARLLHHAEPAGPGTASSRVLPFLGSALFLTRSPFTLLPLARA
jgi:peptidoglycan hydrolase-like protein with peptidoglycan-binding domain